jgi:glycosyltransferase involved in cell wall biosynthesis
MIAYTFYELDYRVRRYAELLVKQDNRVDVIALRRDGEPCNGIFKGVNVFRVQRRNYNEKGQLSYFFKICYFFIKGTLVLLKNHIRYRYRVIHIHNVPDYLVFMALIPKLMGARIILDIHDILPEFYCQKFNKSMDTFLAKLLLRVERVSVKFADHIIVANDIWREKIITRNELSPDKCTTLLNYPNMKFFNQQIPRSANETFKIIYPGTISHLHGLDIAIRALSIAKKEIPKILLDIYTRANNLKYYDYLKELINQLGLNDNVKFYDPVPVEELNKIYGDADIGIVPKREGVFAGEAFSTKILEYMAAGIPIIASKTRIDEYYFDDSLIMFFKPEDYQDLADCIVSLYRNQERRRSLIKKGKEYIAKNNWELKCRGYDNIIERLTE